MAIAFERLSPIFQIQGYCCLTYEAMAGVTGPVAILLLNLLLTSDLSVSSYRLSHLIWSATVLAGISRHVTPPISMIK